MEHAHAITSSAAAANRFLLVALLAAAAGVRLTAFGWKSSRTHKQLKLKQSLR
jgi:hypothetical protein